MDKHVEKFILFADSKALATWSESGINVVPVSSVNIVDGKIWLIDYFMDKTRNNFLKNNNVALACWKAMMGYQIKGTALYRTDGEDFEKAKAWIKEVLPERVVKGLIIITPEEVHDISPTKDTKEKFVVD